MIFVVILWKWIWAGVLRPMSIAYIADVCFSPGCPTPLQQELATNIPPFVANEKIASRFPVNMFLVRPLVNKPVNHSFPIYISPGNIPCKIWTSNIQIQHHYPSRRWRMSWSCRLWLGRRKRDQFQHSTSGSMTQWHTVWGHNHSTFLRVNSMIFVVTSIWSVNFDLGVWLF